MRPNQPLWTPNGAVDDFGLPVLRARRKPQHLPKHMRPVFREVDEVHLRAIVNSRCSFYLDEIQQKLKESKLTRFSCDYLSHFKGIIFAVVDLSLCSRS